MVVPFIRFFLLRWVWRYGLWSALLNKIAKLNLDLRPTHLDLLGGLGIVRFAQRHFGILFAALGAFVAGQYANSITCFGLPIKDSMAPMVVFVVISVLVVLGPLTLFSPKLADAKRNGLAQYSQLARRLTASFDSKWLNETDANAFALSPARQAGGNFLSFFALPPWPDSSTFSTLTTMRRSSASRTSHGDRAPSSCSTW